MPGSIYKYQGPTSSTKLKSDLKLASDGYKIYAEARKYVQKLGISRGSARDYLCPTFWFLAPPYQNIGLGNNGGVQEEKSFSPLYPYKFRLKRAWNYVYLAHQIQHFLKQRGTAPFHHPKSYRPKFWKKRDGKHKFLAIEIHFFSQESSVPFNPPKFYVFSSSNTKFSLVRVRFPLATLFGGQPSWPPRTPCASARPAWAAQGGTHVLGRMGMCRSNGSLFYKKKNP